MQEKNKDKNQRNKSTTNPNNTNNSNNSNNKAPTSNTAYMNKSGNGVRKPESVGMVKLPKVSTIGSSSVSNTSVKAIWDGVKKSGHEATVPTASREARRK